MANPFDEFDEVQSVPRGGKGAAVASMPVAANPNPFDQFDELPGQVPQGRPEKREASLRDRVRAAASGVNKGFFSDLLGAPVDTVQNIIDLGKAFAGTAANGGARLAHFVGSGFKDAGPIRTDLMPTVNSDRSGIVGSSAWIEKKINDMGMGGAINNPAPDDAASRILHMGGRVGGASILPVRSAPIGGAQQATNIGKGMVGGIAAGATGEVAPEWAGLAGMIPSAVSAGTSAIVKGTLRGGEKGRIAMEQRVQDLKAGGIDEPSVGLATGNRLVLGVENLLSQTPGSVGLFQKAKDRMVDGMQAKANQIRDDISPVYGPVEAGAGIQVDLAPKGAFKNRVDSTFGRLNNRVEQAVGQNTPVPVSESLRKLDFLTTPIPGAEATSSLLINPKFKSINEAMSADAGGKPAQVINSAIVLPNGAPASQTIIPAVPPQGIPFSALKNLRTEIGTETVDQLLMGSREKGGYKQLYGGMSQDMKSAVAAADARDGIAPTAGGSATTALNRANDFYSRASDRAEQLTSLVNRSTPEGAYGAVTNSLNAGPTVYERLRGAVTPETRKKIVATVVDEMGMAKAGQQGADGDTWSGRAFLTNYNRMDPQTRTELFKRLPGGKQHGESLDQIAKAADMLDQGSKVWANPSGTSQALTARGTFYALTAGAFFQPVLAATTAAGLGAANAGSRLLLNPIFTNWLAKAPKVKPQDAQAYALRLMNNAKMTNDKQFRQDVNDYLRSVQETFDDEE